MLHQYFSSGESKGGNHKGSPPFAIPFPYLPQQASFYSYDLVLLHYYIRTGKLMTDGLNRD